MIQPYQGHRPRLGKNVRIHDSAVVIGRVELGDSVNLWPDAVLRGDCDDIRVGARTNIQDLCVIHNEPGIPAVVGADCTVGHQACLHGCVVGDRCLIGIHATVLTRAEIGEDSVVGAGALVPEGKRIPPRSLVLGVPGKVVRTLTDGELGRMKANVEEYLRLAADQLPILDGR